MLHQDRLFSYDEACRRKANSSRWRRLVQFYRAQSPTCTVSSMRSGAKRKISKRTYSRNCVPQRARLSVILGLLLATWFAPYCEGYGVLTHEAIIDAAWKDDIIPVLLRRFPN